MTLEFICLCGETHPLKKKHPRKFFNFLVAKGTTLTLPPKNTHSEKIEKWGALILRLSIPFITYDYIKANQHYEQH